MHLFDNVQIECRDSEKAHTFGALDKRLTAALQQSIGISGVFGGASALTEKRDYTNLLLLWASYSGIQPDIRQISCTTGHESRS